MEKTIEELSKELEEIKKQRDEYLAGWQRERADLLNHKKDEVERMQELIKFANEEFLLRVFPIIDSFERAFRMIPEERKNDQVTQGFLQIQSQFNDFLKAQGVEEVKTEGKFDPKLHEAIEEIKVEGKSPGDIVEVLEKGYTIDGKLIRPAKVKVAK